MVVAKQFSVMVENKRGALAGLCSKLAEKAVNIVGLMVPEQLGVAPIRLVVNNSDAARKVLEGMGLKFTEEDVLAVQVSNRPGALGKLTRKLADHDLDVKYAYATIQKGVDKATVILALSEPSAAAKLL
ncbi:MAG: hypothetical protein ABSF45_01990 [Terriglobia bacterium]